MWFLCMPLFGEIQAKGLEDYGPHHGVERDFVSWPPVAIVTTCSLLPHASYSVAQRTLSGPSSNLVHLGFDALKRTKPRNAGQVNISGRASFTVSHQQRRSSFEHPLIGSRLKDSLKKPPQMRSGSEIRSLGRPRSFDLLAMAWLSFFCRSLLSRLLVTIAQLLRYLV